MQLSKPVSITLMTYGFLLGVFIVWLALFKPLYNWDIVAYVGVVLSFDTQDVYALHESTYEVLRDNIPSPFYERLLQGSYGQAVYQDAAVFSEQLNFYSIKPLYICLIYLLSKLGFSIVTSITLVSTVSSVITTWLFLRWMSHYSNPHLAVLLTFFLGLQARLFDLSRIATPDALSTLIMSLALFALLERKNIKLVCILLFLAIMARVNNVIFATLLLSYLTLAFRLRGANAHARLTGLALTLCMVAYFGIGYIALSYSWWTLFYHSFVEHLTQPSVFEVSFSLSTYFNVIQQKVLAVLSAGATVPTVLPVFVFITGLAAFFSVHKQKVNALGLLLQPKFMLCVLILLNYGAYTILFPGVEQWDRFFTSFYMLAGVLCLQLFPGFRITKIM